MNLFLGHDTSVLRDRVANCQVSKVRIRKNSREVVVWSYF